MSPEGSISRSHRTDRFTPAGPNTLAGKYLREFWQPIYHSIDLAPGRAVPLRVMGEDFTLYRADKGNIYLLDARCPHRGTRLSTGWVQGEDIRCFYHGWKFAGDGRCIEQPAEDSEFCHKAGIRAYPAREYLGLIFAFFGEGEAPEFPTYPEFEYFDGMIEVDSYYRACNYFQNLDNTLDMSHVGFVHGDNRASFNGFGRGRQLSAEETDWGVKYRFVRDDGMDRINQFGMPNIFYMNALPTDPEIGWQESLFWWVPIDDVDHVQFSLHRVPVTGEVADRIEARRQQRRNEINIPHQEICEDILWGRVTWADIDTSRVDMVRLQDDVAQLGQGTITDRSQEHLGRADVGLITIRKLWDQETNAFTAGKPLTRWRRDKSISPKAWSLEGTASRAGDTAKSGSPRIVDVRPYVEIEVMLEKLHGDPKGKNRFIG